MLAGGVTTVAFTAVLRVRAVVDAAGAGAVANRTLLVIGLFSMLVAALFLLSARDFKRMLAYSSVEHMGILSVRRGPGRRRAVGGLLSRLEQQPDQGRALPQRGQHSRAAAGARTDGRSRAAWRVLTPRSAALFVAGLFAVTACPPFGPFFSELLIVRTRLRRARVGGGLLSGLSVAGVSGADPGGVCDRGWTAAPGRARELGQRFRETLPLMVPPLVLLLLALWLGLATPDVLREAWTTAVQQLTPTP